MKRIHIILILQIVILLMFSCGSPEPGQYGAGDASNGELIEITEEDEQPVSVKKEASAEPDTASEDATAAEMDDKDEAGNTSGSNSVDIKQNNRDFEDPYDLGDAFYSETGAAIVPHGSLYPKGFDIADVPEYRGKKYVLINDGEPFFADDELTTEAFEYYSSLDELGRCGTAYANICRELMPAEKRGDISEIHPTGWRQKRYDGIVDSDPPYLYNRSHLIAYKLAGENANVYNLITGTRYFNADGMSYVEDRVTEYVKNTGHHVLYRVTPVFLEEELLSRGVLMEARSVEDDKICFCEFVYNVQPGIYIDYSDGYNKLMP